MPRQPRPEIVYYHRGVIERTRAGKGRHANKSITYPGYSAVGPTGGVLYPWMTKTECREDARRQGATAVFRKE